MDLRDRIQARQVGVDNFQISRDLLCYYSKGARRRRWVVPVSLRPMLLKYFHDSVLSGHYVSSKNFQKIIMKFW